MPIDEAGVKASWGPFECGIAPAERIARLRAVRALALVFARQVPNLHFLLKQAENNEAALAQAERAIDRLRALPKRRLLATYADLGS